MITPTESAGTSHKTDQFEAIAEIIEGTYDEYDEIEEQAESEMEEMEDLKQESSSHKVDSIKSFSITERSLKIGSRA